MGFAVCCVPACSGLGTEGTGRLDDLLERLSGTLELYLVGGGCGLLGCGVVDCDGFGTLVC